MLQHHLQLHHANNRAELLWALFLSQDRLLEVDLLSIHLCIILSWSLPSTNDYDLIT